MISSKELLKASKVHSFDASSAGLNGLAVRPKIKKEEGHINLPSKIFQSYDTTIILNIKMLVLLSGTYGERQKAGFLICCHPETGRDNECGD